MRYILAILSISFFVKANAQAQSSMDTTQVSIGRKLDCSREKALIILDSKRFPCDSLQYLVSEDIEEILVLSSKEATKLYGNVSGAYGAIVFTTKKYSMLRKGKEKNNDPKP